MYFYQRVKDVREDFGLAQWQVADLLYITRQQYQLYESGKREIPMHLMIILADYYGVPIDYLADRSDSDYSEHITKAQPDSPRLYHKIRDIREDHDMPQREIAAVLEITPQQYQLYESGKREMPMHLFIKLADYYEVTIDYLVGRDKRSIFDNI